MELLLAERIGSKIHACVSGKWLTTEVQGTLPELPISLRINDNTYYFRKDVMYVLMPCRTRETMHVIPQIDADAFGQCRGPCRGLTVDNGDFDSELCNMLDAVGVSWLTASRGSLEIVNSAGRFSWKIKKCLT